MEIERMLGFLGALEINNNREWFHENDAWYREAKNTFETLLEALMKAITPFDPISGGHSPKDVSYRLMRDIRFSRDKSPYNPSFRAHIAPGGKLPIPCGYYICLRPGDRSFLGGGLCADFPDAYRMVRVAIAADGEGFLRACAEMGMPVLGKALKRVPAGFDPNHPLAEYLKYKGWYVEYPLPDTLVQEPQHFVSEVSQACKRMKHLDDFLNMALVDIKMPVKG